MLSFQGGWKRRFTIVNLIFWKMSVVYSVNTRRWLVHTQKKEELKGGKYLNWAKEASIWLIHFSRQGWTKWFLQRLFTWPCSDCQEIVRALLHSEEQRWDRGTGEERRERKEDEKKYPLWILYYSWNLMSSVLELWYFTIMILSFLVKEKKKCFCFDICIAIFPAVNSSNKARDMPSAVAHYVHSSLPQRPN